MERHHILTGAPPVPAPRQVVAEGATGALPNRAVRRRGAALLALVALAAGPLTALAPAGAQPVDGTGPAEPPVAEAAPGSAPEGPTEGAGSDHAPTTTVTAPVGDTRGDAAVEGVTDGPVPGAPANPPPLPAAPVVAETPAGRLRAGTVAVSSGSRRATPGPTVVPVPAGTDMVGLTWEGSPDAEVQLRAANADGSWGPWVDLHAAGGEAPDLGTEGTTRQGLGPVWLGSPGTDAVELQVLEGEVAGLELEAMAWESGAGTRAAATVDQPATPAGGPAIHTRTAWASGSWQGWRDGCSADPPQVRSVQFGIVHHTVNANTYAADDVPGLLAGIYRYHTASRGWCDVGYNFFVDRFGRVWQGRSGDLNGVTVGGHTQGFNSLGFGVALLGQHDSASSPAPAPPTAAAKAAVRDVLAWKLGALGLDPNGRTTVESGGSPRYPAGTTVTLPVIQGHRDTGLTSCPGDLAYRDLAEIRSGVAQVVAATNEPARWTPHTSAHGYFAQVRRDAEGGAPPNGHTGMLASLVVRAGFPRDYLLASVVLSPISDTRVGAVDRLYRATFGRPPDPSGLAYWVGRRDAGVTVEQIANGFVASTEFRRTYAGLDDRGFITKLYRNVLGRDPDAGGARYWYDRLQSGTTRAYLVAFMSASSEHKRRTDVKVRVTTGFFVMLRRPPNRDQRILWEWRLGQGYTNDQFAGWLGGTRTYAARFS